MDKVLKIYTDKQWLPDNCNHIIMLYPFWGNIELPLSDPDMGRFDEYINNGKDIFTLVNSIENCDYALLPFEYSFETNKHQLVQQVAFEVKKHLKKLIVFFNSDINNRIEIDNAIVFRTSFFKSTQVQHEFAFPGWSVDFLKKYSISDFILPKKNTAKISYCGYIDTLNEKSTLDKLKRIFFSIKKEEFSYGSYVRGKGIRKLLMAKKINTSFIIRDGFWAQGITNKHQAREEYFINMFNSPYAFVTRGAGNFSYRLYEVMSCGRIPIFVNTDSVLPYENLIDWKKQCVWVEEKNINLIEDIVSNFHTNISQYDFELLQQKNRDIYEKFLSPLGFFKHIHTLL